MRLCTLWHSGSDEYSEMKKSAHVLINCGSHRYPYQQISTQETIHVGWNFEAMNTIEEKLHYLMLYFPQGLGTRLGGGWDRTG